MRQILYSLIPVLLNFSLFFKWDFRFRNGPFFQIRYIRGQHIFSFLAVDDGGVEIRVSAFGDTAYRTASLIYPEQVILQQIL